jgi:hypothetical protein
VNPYLYDLELILSWPENSGWVMEQIDALSSVPSAAIHVPSALVADSIERITPNPFNPVTEIVFRLNSDEHATLMVYDLSGRLVRKLLSAHMSKGEHSLVWDGKTDFGRGASSGVYFIRLQTDRGVDTRRGLMIK